MKRIRIENYNLAKSDYAFAATFKPTAQAAFTSQPVSVICGKLK